MSCASIDVSVDGSQGPVLEGGKQFLASELAANSDSVWSSVLKSRFGVVKVCLLLHVSNLHIPWIFPDPWPKANFISQPFHALPPYVSYFLRCTLHVPRSLWKSLRHIHAKNTMNSGSTVLLDPTYQVNKTHLQFRCLPPPGSTSFISISN